MLIRPLILSEKAVFPEILLWERIARLGLQHGLGSKWHLGLKHSFWFYGASYDEKSTGKLLYNADICVSPGSIGLTAIHSLVYGTPVITHSHFSSQGPEFEVIEQGKTGSFFEKDNVDELAECIINWLLNNKGKRREVRMDCYRKIDQSYTPMKELEILNSVIH